jgi:hypothetical protein
MSGRKPRKERDAANHYSRQAAELEAVLHAKLQHLTVLQKEREHLTHKVCACNSVADQGLTRGLILITVVIRYTVTCTHALAQCRCTQALTAAGGAHKPTDCMLPAFPQPPVVLLPVLTCRLQEKALKAAIHGMEGTLTVTKEALLEPSAREQPAGSSPAHNAGQHSQDSMRSNADSANQSSHSRNSDDPQHTLSTTSSRRGLPLAPVSYKDSQALLQRLERRERQVQDTLQHLGCEPASYTHMYSTQLLRRALADSGRVAAHLAMSQKDRLDFVAEVGTWVGNHAWLRWAYCLWSWLPQAYCLSSSTLNTQHDILCGGPRWRLVG